MTEVQNLLPKWILLVSGILALLELAVSVALWFSPQSVIENVDLNVTGVQYLVYMWAARQLALAVILAYATIKRSKPMLTLSYIFLLIMFMGDIVVGLIQKENSLIIAGLVMAMISATFLFFINKRK